MDTNIANVHQMSLKNGGNQIHHSGRERNNMGFLPGKPQLLEQKFLGYRLAPGASQL